MTQEEKQIQTETIKKDIDDTKIDIEQFEREEEGFRLVGNRISVMRADYRKHNIEECKQFIEQLEAILEMRENG
jgi:ribosome maturation factor RimP